jgi:hypothetical protein
VKKEESTSSTVGMALSLAIMIGGGLAAGYWRYFRGTNSELRQAIALERSDGGLTTNLLAAPADRSRIRWYRWREA